MAAGIVRGVTGSEITENSPVPAVLTATTRNTYAVPLVSPETVAERTVETERTTLTQVAPLSAERSMT